MVHAVKTTPEKYNMKLSSSKAKSLVVLREPKTCKIVIDGETVEQVSRLNYIEMEILSHCDLQEEVRKQG